jgi:hypothetical protein
LSSVNLLKSSIGVEQALAIVKIKEAKPNLKTLCGFALEETEVDMSKQGLLPEDAILLASDIPDMRSLSKLDLSGNSIGDMDGEPGVKAIAEALKVNRAITEISLASNSFDAECAEILAPAIEASGLLSKLDLSKNKLRSEGLSVVSQALKSTSIKQLNIAENKVTYNTQDDEDISGVIKFAKDMKDMGSLSKLIFNGGVNHDRTRNRHHHDRSRLQREEAGPHRSSNPGCLHVDQVVRGQGGVGFSQSR